MRENYAKGIVLIATTDDLAGVKVRKGNVLSALEAEVGIESEQISEFMQRVLELRK